MTATKIFLIEDHPLMRQGIKSLISSDAAFKIVGEASSLKEAREQMKKVKFDLVLMDISLPDGVGLDLLPEIKSISPTIKAVVLTMHSESPYLAKSINLGASGYVAKDMVPEKLMLTLENVVRGENCFITPAPAPSNESKSERGTALSPREELVRVKLKEGRTLTEIAEELQLSVKTVFTYRVRLLKKLGLQSNDQL
jgi:two-component system invasion response regulator UvrY